MSSFEVHTFRRGAWKMESVYDDKELATAAAEMMIGEPEVDDVRVAQPVMVGSERKYRILFRANAAPPKPKPPPAKAAAPKARPPRRGRGPAPSVPFPGSGVGVGVGVESAEGRGVGSG